MPFEKGHKYGNRFSSDNQPKPSKRKGGKPSLYKQLKKITGKEVGFELGKEDYLNIIQWAMGLKFGEVEDIIQNQRTEIPLWLLNILCALRMGIKKGQTDTVEMIFDRVFGKATQTLEGELNVNNNLDFSNFSTEELIQYNSLLDKAKKQN